MPLSHTESIASLRTALEYAAEYQARVLDAVTLMDERLAVHLYVACEAHSPRALKQKNGRAITDAAWSLESATVVWRQASVTVPEEASYVVFWHEVVRQEKKVTDFLFRVAFAEPIGSFGRSFKMDWLPCFQDHYGAPREFIAESRRPEGFSSPSSPGKFWMRTVSLDQLDSREAFEQLLLEPVVARCHSR